MTPDMIYRNCVLKNELQENFDNTCFETSINLIEQNCRKEIFVLFLNEQIEISLFVSIIRMPLDFCIDFLFSHEFPITTFLKYIKAIFCSKKIFKMKHERKRKNSCSCKITSRE